MMTGRSSRLAFVLGLLAVVGCAQVQGRSLQTKQTYASVLDYVNSTADLFVFSVTVQTLVDPSIPAVLADPNFAGTLFAPTNEGGQVAPNITLAIITNGLLSNLVSFTISPSSTNGVSDFAKGSSLPTLFEGHNLRLAKKGSVLQVFGENPNPPSITPGIVLRTVKIGKATIHVINTTLWPILPIPVR